MGSFDAGFGTAFLARVVGEKRAREIWYFCRQYDAATAERWGLVNRVVPAAELDEAVDELVGELTALSPLALKIGKEGFYKQVELPQAEAYELVSEAISCNAVAQDGQEGISAFIEKRKPNWTGK